VDEAGGKFDPATGYYATLRYAGCETQERATEIKNALFRAGRGMGYSVDAKVHADDSAGNWYVEFSAVNKAHARAYVTSKYGKDPERWPYHPNRAQRGKPE
jgi:hypothetical protein